MSNVDNEGLRTLEQARSGRPAPQYGTNQRLNPGELEEIEAAARRGAMLAPNETLALVNTITALTRRIAVRFNETAEARQAVTALSERVASLETELAARGPMADLGHLADAVAGRERAEQRNQRLVDEMAHHNRVKDSRIAELERERSDMLNNGAAGIVGRRLQQRVQELEAQVGEYERDATERTRVVDQIRQRFRIAPGEDLYEGLCRKVGDLQTSEAELVSAPLHRQIEELKQSVQARDRLLEEASRKREAAEHRAARAARRIEEMENQGNQAVAAINERDQALEAVADVVYAEQVTGALEEIGDRPTQYPHLAQAVRGVRAAMPAWLDRREESGA